MPRRARHLARAGIFRTARPAAARQPRVSSTVQDRSPRVALSITALLDALFPAGHAIVREGDFLAGSGTVTGKTVAVVGTANAAAIGVELALSLAGEVLRVVQQHPGR